MNQKGTQILLYCFLAIYALPVVVLSSSVWLHIFGLGIAREIAQSYSGGMEYIVNGLLILFLTLSSPRHSNQDEIFWTAGTVTTCIVLAFIGAVSLVLAATIRNDSQVMVMLSPIEAERLYQTVLHYTTETMSYAGLVLGIRYGASGSR
jgi:hypothetical protein